MAKFFPAPLWNIAVVWSGIIWIGTLIRCIYNLLGGKSEMKTLEMCWAVFQTFVFITWTRLFFRAGSNLDPAEANEKAWNTAKDMVGQIGGKWDFSIIPSIVEGYWNVFLLIVLGMIIHWMPTRAKRWYRIRFALLPTWSIVLIAIVAIIAVYQFVTADMQPFIYFQF
jgi:hypothetical protein